MDQSQLISIPNTKRFDFMSSGNGRQYSVSIAYPSVTPPDGGFRPLYVLDGYAYFGSATEATRANFNAPDVVVIGIGYPDNPEFIESVLEQRRPLPKWLQGIPPKDAAYALQRQFDLTLPVSADEIIQNTGDNSDKPDLDNTGGLNALLDTIENEIKPRVDAILPIDHGSGALFGHSLGGLAVVHALFTRPRAFRTYVASSPSIWWNQKAVLNGEADFCALVEAGKIAPRVLITMGELEDFADPKVAAKFNIDPAEFTETIRQARMIANARELTDRLTALRGNGAFVIEDFVLFAEQGHGIAPWPALGRAVKFAFD